MRFFGTQWINELSSAVPWNIQRRLLNYALRKVLKPLVYKDLTADDIDLQLRNGNFRLSGLELRVETVNDYLERFGLTLVRGTIGSLDVNVQWADLLSGRLYVNVQSLQITLRPKSAQEKQVGHTDLTESLLENTAETAQSFLVEEAPNDLGVGSEEVSNPAILQSFLEGMLAGLSVVLADTTIILQDIGSQSDTVAQLGHLDYRPDETGKVVRGSDIKIGLRPRQSASRRSSSSTLRRAHSGSSRSTSSSSTDAKELMQSTIFEREEGRSLYMSAINSSSIYHSAIMEEDSEEQCQESIIAHCAQGFTAILDQKPGGLYLDFSCHDVRATCNRHELEALIACILPYMSLHNNGSLPSPTQSTLALELRCTRLSLNLDARDSMITQPSENKERNFRAFGVDFARLSVNSVPGAYNFKVYDGAVTLSGTTVLSKDVPSTSMLVEGLIQSNGAIKVSSHALVFQCDFDEAISDFTYFEGLLVEIAGKIPALNKSNVVDGTLTKDVLEIFVPKFQFMCRTRVALIDFRLHDVTLVARLLSGKKRYSLEFSKLKLAIGLDDFVESDPNEVNVLDFTSIYDKPSSRTLEFLRYEELFEVSERDSKREQDTLNALKQKSKDGADQIIRASFATLRCRLSLAMVQRIVELKDCLCATIADVRQGHFTSGPSTAVVTLLVEIRGIDCQIATGLSILHLDCSQISIFAVQGLKAIDACAVEIGRLRMVSRTQDTRTSIISEGYHATASKQLRAFPMFSLRGRRNLRGLQAGLVRLRLGLTDMHLEYYAEMKWLIDLLEFANSAFSDTKPHKTSTVEGTCQSIKLSLDLTNTCVGLNPYATSAKGLLYFRKSAVNFDLDPARSSSAIKIYAGVVDLFLTDNIEGGPNDLTHTTRDRKDFLTSTLLKLGFVKVASAETVEIEVKRPQVETQFSNSHCVELTGAILTIWTCADSTATLISLITMLRLPVVISDDLKYKSGLASKEEITLDVFNSIDEDAFKKCRLPDAEPEQGTKSGAEVTLPDNALHAISSLLGTEAALLIEDDKAIEDSFDLMAEHFLPESIPKKAQVSGNENASRQRSIFEVEAKNCFVIWNLHDGYDWERTRQKIVLAIDSAVAKARKAEQQDDWVQDTDTEDDKESASSQSSEIGDLLFNSIYIALPHGANSQELTKSINQELAQAAASDDTSQTTTTVKQKRSLLPDINENKLELGRSKIHKVRIEASGATFNLDYKAADEGKVLYSTKLKIRDLEIFDNVSTSTWRKFLTYHRALGLREDESYMIDAEISNIKPVASLAAAELTVRLAVLPLRLHVDQDTLEFITRFFEFRDDEAVIPVLSPEEIFVQRFEVLAIPIQIDYKPKRVDYKSLRSGRTTEFKNFFILEDSNMILKHVILYGICGFSRIFEILNDIWLANIKSEQLGTVLAGVSPLRSLASFSGSLKDLVMVPLADYQKDGRILPGLKKGLSSFAKSTGSEAVRLGAKLAVGTQGLLESAETMLNDKSQSSQRVSVEHAISMYANQPRDLRQGVSQAMSGMTRNFATARDTIVSLPKDMEDQSDTRGAVQLAARSVPIAVIRPLIGTTEMVSKTLLGLRNTMNPEQRKLNDDKYK